MRILIIHPCAISYATFHKINLLAKVLKDHGDEVAILTPGTDKDRLPYDCTPAFDHILLSFDGAWLSRAVKRRVNAFDPDIIHVWNPRTFPSRVALELMVGTGARLVVNYEDPEHFHFDTVTGPVKCASILDHVDKPYLTSDDIEQFAAKLNWHWILQHIRNPESSQFIHPLFYALLNHLASGFTGIWHPWVELLKSRFQKPVALLPFGIDFTSIQNDPAAGLQVRKDLNIPAKATVFLRSGTLYTMIRDVDNMLAGFAEHLRTHPDSRLVLCGKDQTADQTAESIRRLGIASNTIRLGYLTDEKLDALTNAADVVVCPGYPDEYNEYRLAIKIIDYMARGKAMICYASGIGKDLKDGTNAILLPTYTPQTVADAMTRLADDPALRNAIGREARAFAEIWFDIKKIALRIHIFYSDILASPAATPSPGTIAPESILDWDQAVRVHSIWEDKLGPFSDENNAVYIYGAGKHTESLQQFGWLDRLHVTAILDDASPKQSIGNTPVIRPSNAKFEKGDLLVISSDANEQLLYTKACAFFPPDRIVRIYTNGTPGEPK